MKISESALIQKVGNFIFFTLEDEDMPEGEIVAVALRIIRRALLKMPEEKSREFTHILSEIFNELEKNPLK